MSDNNNNFNLDWITGYSVERLYFSNKFFKSNGEIDPRAKALKKTIKSFPKTFKEFYESLVGLPEFFAIYNIGSTMPSGGGMWITFILKIEDKFSYFRLAIPMRDTLAFASMKENEKKPGYFIPTNTSKELHIDECINLQHYMESFEKEFVWRFDESIGRDRGCLHVNPDMECFLDSMSRNSVIC